MSGGDKGVQLKSKRPNTADHADSLVCRCDELRRLMVISDWKIRGSHSLIVKSGSML